MITVCMNTRLSCCVCSDTKPERSVHRPVQVKAFLADPSAFVVEAAPEAAAGGGSGGAAEAKEEAKEEEKEEEEEEDEDMGFSLFD